jgi:hypothetical protein
MESQLDWFHIGMKLELLRKAVVMPVTYQEYFEDPQAFDPVQLRISRLRDALWLGRSWQARLQFAWLRGDIDRWAAEHPGGCTQSVRRAKQVIREFRYYVCGNRRSLPDFAKDLLGLNVDLPSVMQAGRWRDTRMPMRYGEKVLAGRGAMARAAKQQGRA